MKKLNVLASTAIAVVSLAAGCTVFAPRTDDTRYFILSPETVVVSASPLAPGDRLAVGIGPITIPGYLDRPEVVTRTSATELKVSNNERWGERLRSNVATVLSQGLSSQLPGVDLMKFPWPLNSAPDYQVSVDFQRLELTGDGQTQVVATWIIRSTSDHRQLQAGSTNVSAAAGKDEKSASEALSHGVAQVSRDIAQALSTQFESRKSAKP